jgi:hypothetical protein
MADLQGKVVEVRRGARVVVIVQLSVLVIQLSILVLGKALFMAALAMLRTGDNTEHFLAGVLETKQQGQMHMVVAVA